jgi:hypothetical protein
MNGLKSVAQKRTRTQTGNLAANLTALIHVKRGQIPPLKLLQQGCAILTTELPDDHRPKIPDFVLSPAVFGYVTCVILPYVNGDDSPQGARQFNTCILTNQTRVERV